MSITIYPYETLDREAGLSVGGVRLDAEEAKVNIVVDSHALINAYIIETNWETVTVDVEVSVSRDALDSLPATHKRIGITLVAHCQSTNYRASINLTKSGSDKWYGSLTICKSDVRGHLQMTAHVVAEIGGQTCRPIGCSRTWKLHVDKPAVPELEGHFDVIWENFADPGTTSPSSLRKYKEDEYFADLQEVLPRIYLNSSIDGLPQLLDDKRTRPAGEAALHNATRYAIARAVWIALFNAAAAGVLRSVDGDGEETVDWPAEEWQARVLRRFLPRIYKEVNEREALRRLAVDAVTPDGAEMLQTLAQAEVNAHLQTGMRLRRSIADLETGKEVIV